MGFNEGQPRDQHGRWAATGSVGRQPVGASAGAASVHTRLRASARDAVIRGKLVDQSSRARPIRTDAEITSRTDFGRPSTALNHIIPGRFNAAKELRPLPFPEARDAMSAARYRK